MTLHKLYLLMAGLISITSCIAKSDFPEGQDTPPTELNGTKALKYMALGDSYTIGEAVAVDKRFPVQLQKKLEAEDIDISPSEIIARTGWTTDELMNAIRQTNPKGPYQLVTLLIGVNNQYRGRDTLEYRRQFRELLHKAITLAGNNASRVVVVSIPDYGKTPFGQMRNPEKIGLEIDRFNSINLQETRKTSAVYVDITPISRRGLSEPELVAPDGLHPSGEMYRLWVELLLPAAQKILSSE
jgi:lysophospholipase L1-like esterase